MKLYLDSDFRCHLTDGGGMRPFETDLLDGKCKEYVEGYRIVPDGETWTAEDGTVLRGFLFCPAVEIGTLEYAQRQYEADDSARLADLNIPQEQDFTATRNYPVDAFIGIYGQLYEVIRSIPQYTSIIPGQNVIKTTVEHYLDTLKEGE